VISRLPGIRTADRIAIVVGGGGDRVIAWQVGVLAGLADAGVDAGAAMAILGTSAGSVAAARLAAGIDARTDADRIAATPPVAVPNQLRRSVAEAVPKVQAIVWGNGVLGNEAEHRRRAGQLAIRQRGVLSVRAHVERQATRLPDVDWPPNLGLVVIDADTGERVVLDAMSGVGLVEGVAGARAVPGLVEPVRVGDRRVIDGALSSATNADLLLDGADLAIVIMATPWWAQAGSLEARWNEALEAERSALATRWVRVVVVHACSAAGEAMGEDLMSTDGAPSAVVVGREQGAEVGTEILVGAGR
jgi:NTE family protein